MNTLAQSFRDLNQIKLAAMIATAVVMIGFFAFISLRVTSPSMAPLYASVSLEDGAKIVAELDKENVKYELRSGGTQILVPADMVDRLRLTMAQNSLPSAGSGVGYEIFDKSNTLGTPNFVLNINQVRALEGELARTIQGFDTVDAARVHLVIPTHELFSRQTSDPTASVAVKLRGAGGLSKNEVAAIRQLVATAVPGLKPQRVTVVDSHGTLLAKGQDKNSDPNAVSEESDAYRVEYETRLSGTVERLLEQSVGASKVKAEVHADIDFDRIVTNKEKYDPEGQVARSTQSVSDNEKSSDTSNNQTVSAANNIPGGSGAGGAAGGSQANHVRTEETTNFEINKEVTNSIKESGNVKKLSVAVLVDGTYTTDKDGKQVYAPRTPEELKKLEELVKTAVGFDAARGDTVSIVNMQFVNTNLETFTAGPFDWIKQDLNSIIQTMVLGGVAILSILLVIRPLVARAIESVEMASKEDALEQAALAAPSITARLMDQSKLAPIEEPEEEEDMINIDRIQGKLKSSSYTKINSMVDKHPTETAQILKAWLSGM
ncbi:MAG: flagellar M-ring protein FliF [Rhodospirillales bacterium 12-54-5]|nr:MAG: flagellar M-ring protein FliF [Rhodospirillales bacterium 12-54-5]